MNYLKNVGCSIIMTLSCGFIFGSSSEAQQKIQLSIYQKSEPIQFVQINPSSFQMGSPTTEKHRDLDEKSFQVELTKPYWIAVYETTAEQWEEIMGKRPEYFKWANLSNAPVNQVTWNEVMIFCEKITTLAKEKGLIKASQKFTLPTEAQWELACRSGKQEPYSTDEDLREYAVFKDNHVSMLRVGSKKPNSFGIYDMHGNVAEWCLDGYEPYPEGEMKDFIGGAKAIKKVARGGSWANFKEDLRSAKRFPMHPGNRASYIGFRIVMIDSNSP